jgi:hypothetical protein
MVWTPRLDGYPPLIRRKLVSVDFVPTRFNVESATLNTSGPTLHHLGSSTADRAMFLLTPSPLQSGQVFMCVFRFFS